MTALTLSPGRKTLFRWHRPSLEDRLRALMPHWGDLPLSISSEDLDSNASFVDYVRHHKVIDPLTGEPLELVEKSIRKVLFIGSQEARFHRATGLLDGSTQFRHPACLGVIDTPWESLIFTTYLRGKPPRMQAIAKPLALGIAEQELLSYHYLQAQTKSQAPLLWSMDFYRPWFLLRPRFNFARYLGELERLGQADPRFAGLATRFKAFVPKLRDMSRQARRSPRCICHMDYLRKNLFLIKQQLHVIDWSEVKVGRIGFDGGAYLGSLFRRKDMKMFLAAHNEFIDAYRAALPAEFDPEQALHNLRYIFLLTALYHCLRPETLAEYSDRERMPLLLQKYEYLLTLLD